MKKILGLCFASMLPLLVGCTASSGVIPTNTRPVAPTGVTATAGTNQVTVSWSPTIAAFAYNVYISNSSGVTTGSPTRVVGLTTTTYTQTPVTHGIPYFYIVTATNGNGEGPSSAQVSAAP